eukprot:scaffold128339_cov47-Attheya_sp.AAC.4
MLEPQAIVGPSDAQSVCTDRAIQIFLTSSVTQTLIRISVSRAGLMDFGMMTYYLESSIPIRSVIIFV